MKAFCATLQAAVAACCLLISWSGAASAGSARPIRVLASIFPVYQITRNVTVGRGAVEVGLMLPAELGCPHDYTLTPHDMDKLGQADVLVVNGLGLEEFLGEQVDRANPKLKIIESSSGIGDLLPETAAHHHEGHHTGRKEAGVNPHIFATPRMAGLMAAAIAAGLADVDPAGADLYLRNARSYAQQMTELADDMKALGLRLANNRIVTQHGIFDYLARDMGLEVVAVVETHGGQEPSAAEMLEIIRTITSGKAGALFTEPQYQEKIGQTIAKEAGIPSAALDPAANGPPEAPLSYFATVMRRNMKILEKSLGTK